MSKIASVGSSAAAAVIAEAPAPEAKAETKSSQEIAATPTPQQDPKDKMSDLKMEGQAREAQVRAQFGSNGPQFKMPGVDVKGPGLDDPKIQDGFKNFDKPMPSVEMKWPEKGAFKETTDKDGAVRREMTDENGNSFKEKIDKNGTRERETIDKNGTRRFEMSDSTGFLLRGGSDKNNSWSFDNKGVSTRTFSDGAGQQFLESKRNGNRTREMFNTQGNFYKERLDNGKLERESGDSQGNRQFESKESKHWMKGFMDTKGNSYTVDSDGTSTRMHQDPIADKTYAEHSFKDGRRTRQIAERNGDVWMENVEGNGKRTVDTYKQIGNATVRQ